jgi:hypothetical protein
MSFVNDLNRWAERTERSIDQVVRKTRLDVVEMVTEKMPVDTGQARGSLIASIGSPANSPDTIDNSGSNDAAVARAMPAISADSNNIFYYTSTLDYVKDLEDGSSRVQAPHGMFKISAIQLRRAIREAIRNAST